MAKRSDKRARLINAAKELFYKKGFSNTTIADIAKLADVPLGNVYYYFKTKDEICEAVIKELGVEINSVITEFNNLSNAEDKLIAMINYYGDRADQVAQYGSVFSGLAQELSRQSSPLIAKAKDVLNELTNWLTEQFQSFYGNQVTAKDQAMKFFANLQGMQALTLAFQDPSITAKQVELLKSEVKSMKVAEAA